VLRLIQWLLVGHVHKFEQVEVAELKKTGCGTVVGKIYIMRCNCGKMKTFEVII